MRRTFIAVAVVTLLVAACGGGETSETTTPVESETTAGATTPETTPPDTSAPEMSTTVTSVEETTSEGDDAGDMSDAATGGEEAALAVAESEFGEIVTDAEGKTLYIFVPDAQGTSTCYDDCAANWPPLQGDVAAGDGLDESLLGTIDRDGGGTQVTYNGWPLYYFAADSAPGDVNGQGVGENWFVIDPSGEVVDG